MFEKWRIKEHMEVTDASGRHLGTVDDVQDDQVKLTRSDSGDRQHHYFAIDQVDRIEDNRVYLKSGAPLNAEFGTADSGATGVTDADTGIGSTALGGTTGTGDVTDYSPASTAKSDDSDRPLFGTSGHGTGVGGSGA